jgi:hypothetical protein
MSVDKKIRPLPKRLSKFQKAVLASYPNARIGSADAVKEMLKPFWNNKVSFEMIGNLGKNAKWAIYTEPESDHIRIKIFRNVIGLSDTSQTKAWQDACNVISMTMLEKLES